MACFSDLPFELQTDIWTLVLPYRGGVQWVEFEGIPHPPHTINKTLELTYELFGDREPDMKESILRRFVYSGNMEDIEYLNSLDNSTPFFQKLHTVVPSVYGKSKNKSENLLSHDVLKEVAETQRCRQLSTYTQVTTLLSTCQTSRISALEYLRNMVPIVAWPLFRGLGPLYRYVPQESCPAGYILLSAWHKSWCKVCRFRFKSVASYDFK